MGGIDYMSYVNYIGCQEVQVNNGDTYYFSPHCDPDTQKITMGVYYDGYCSQNAEDYVNPEDVTGIAFEDVMASTDELDCISCTRSNYPPYYNANNYLCNNIYKHAGKCDLYLAYDIGTNDDQDFYYYSMSNSISENQCSFIESIRLGTYDDYGQIYVSNSQKSSQKASVSGDQKASLIILSLICAGLAVYSCYLHHEITNLLLKSLSGGLMQKKTVSRRSSSKKKKKKFVPKSYSTEYSTDGESGDSRSWS